MNDPISRQIRQVRKERLAFPDDEPRQAWLPLLLEATAIVDAGVSGGIRREEKQGRTLTCHKGCAACCRSHTTIPVYPLELIGITWYTAEKLEGPVREQLKQQLRARLIECGEVHRLAKVLQDYDWAKLAERMQTFDNRRLPE